MTPNNAGTRQRLWSRDGWRFLTAVAMAALFLAPIAFMLTTSLRQIGVPLSRQLEVFPRSPSWDNDPAAIDLAGMGRSALNSTFVVVLAVPLTIFVAPLAGFAMSQLPQRARLILTLVSFAVLMTPVTAVWLPRFVLFKEAGLLDSRLVLVVPALGGTSPFFVLLFLWTFLRIPIEVYESARLDSLIRFTPFIWQAGGELVDDVNRPTRLTIDTPEAREAIQFFIDLSLVHKVVPTEAEVLAISDEDRFINGTTAMLFQSRRVVPTLRQIEDFTWDAAPLPQHEEAAGILHADAYCLSATTENPDAAWKFIEFANGPEGQTLAARVGRTVPSLEVVAESPVFLGPRGVVASGNDLDRFAPPASARVYLDTIPQIRRVPSISTWPEVEEAFNNTLGRAFYGEVPVDDAIAIAIARSEQAFQRAAEEESR